MQPERETAPASAGKRVLLVITAGVAAYKCLELIRRGRERGHAFVCVLTEAAAHFVPPLTLAALSGNKVYTELFSLTDEHEMGHIRLARETDLVLVAPATADFLAKMAHGHADDLASTLMLATDRPVLAAPAMNPQMWAHPATRRNIARLESDGIGLIGPEPGDMACGEVGSGRMSEPAALLAAIEAAALTTPKDERSGEPALQGRHAIVTSGPTCEPIDPVRFIANRSSGRQGHAIAEALARAGCRVTLVSGPVNLTDPAGVEVVHIETALQMAEAVENALPADIAICAAAVADWRPAHAADTKIKKQAGRDTPRIEMVENPDILAGIARHEHNRPALVIGFAAETDNVVGHARAKRERKGCDWILANHVGEGSKVFGGGRNQVTVIRADGEETWPEMDKAALGRRLANSIAAQFARATSPKAASQGEYSTQTDGRDNITQIPQNLR